MISHRKSIYLSLICTIAVLASCKQEPDPEEKKTPKQAEVQILLVDSAGEVIDRQPAHIYTYDREGNLVSKTIPHKEGYQYMKYQDGKLLERYKINGTDTLLVQVIKFDSLMNPTGRYIKTITPLSESMKKTTLQDYSYTHQYNKQGKVLKTLGEGRFSIYYNDSLARDSSYELIKENHYVNNLLSYEYVARNGTDTLYQAYYRYDRNDSLILAAKDMGDMYVETGFTREEGEITKRSYTEDRKNDKLIETAQTDFYSPKGQLERSVKGRKMGDKWHKVRHYYTYNKYGLTEKVVVKNPISRYHKVRVYKYSYW